MNCQYCQNETKNEKFCSRSCACSYNNKLNPKRKLKRRCILCDNIVKSYRSSRCIEHSEEYKKNLMKNRTLKEYHERASISDKHPSWKNVHIRYYARSWNKNLTQEPCRHCGYTKHVELAHIRSVSSFPETALLSEVNSPDNLLPLCPNCHWEFDHPKESAEKDFHLQPHAYQACALSN